MFYEQIHTCKINDKLLKEKIFILIVDYQVTENFFLLIIKSRLCCLQEGGYNLFSVANCKSFPYIIYK